MMKSRWPAWVRDEKGSFSLEASMVFPIVFILTLTMLLMSMYVYQKVILYYIASTTAERTAFGWDNSHRSAASGLAPAGKHDGLYWRLHDDQMLEALFGLAVDAKAPSITLRDAAGNGETSLPESKMRSASAWIPSPYDGKVMYEREIWQRTISVKLRHAISLDPLEALNGRSEPRAAANSAVVDPVEFIRSVDLVRYYTDKFNNRSDGAAAAAEAATILKGRKTAERGGSAK
ncbi:TadE/TadG family type IV pilus assembly protein [Paenibacillus abyssi]